MIEITIKKIAPKDVAGMHISTSPNSSQAHMTWEKFMPRRSELAGPEDNVYYSIQDYPADYPWDRYDPAVLFKTWAAKEVSNDCNLPDGFDQTQIKGGLYACFIHRGTADTIGDSMMHFHTQWLPKSGYILDKSRVHFERLGKEFLGPNNPASEEEVFIPIIAKSK